MQTRNLSGAALDAHRRRINRDAAERELDVAVAMCRRRDEDAVAATVLRIERADALMRAAS